MDLDIDEGDTMTSTSNVVYKFSLITNSIAAGTKVQVKIPFQLNTDGVLSFANLCKEAVYRPSTNSIVNNTLTTCQIKSYTTFTAVEFTVGQAYTGISMYYFYLGYFKNPRSVQLIDSFEVTFSNGFPSGSQTTGLVINYTPNKIYSASLTNGNTKAGTKDTYQLSFKITNDIPKNGFLRLRFPSPWNSAPSNIQTLTSSIKLYGSERAGTYTVIPPITSDVIYGGLFDLQGLAADSTKTIQITISGIENPNYIMTTGSFQISTLDDAKQLIDQVQTGLVIVISQVGTLNVNFTIGNTTVDTPTYLQLSMESSASYSSGGYIEIQAPALYLNFTSTVRCNTIFGLTGSSQTCSKVGTNIVRYQRDVSNKASISISIENLIMPLGVIRNPDPFKIYLKEASGQVVSQNENVIQFTTQPGSCWMVSANRSLTTLNVGNSNSWYQMNFTCGHRIPAKGWINITIPDEMIAFSSTMECWNINGTKINCRLWQNTSSTVLNISSTDVCKSTTDGCLPFELISLTLLRALNPVYIVSPLTSSIQISSFNQFDSSNLLLVDQLTSGAKFQNDLQNGIISAASVVRVGTLTGGQAIYTISFKTQSFLPNGAAVRITFPPDTAFLDGSSLICTVDSTNIRVCTSSRQPYDSSVLSSITIQNICNNPSGCAAPSAGYIVDITQGIVNPFSNKPNTQVLFKIQTLRSHLLTNLIDQGTVSAFPLNLTPNTLAVNIMQPATPIYVGGATTYRLELKNTANMIPSLQNGGRIEILFPAQVDLLSDSCQAQTSTNFMLDCNGFSTSNKVTITSNGQNITKGSTIFVTFVNNVRNPKTSAISDVFSVKTYFQSTFVVDQNLARTVQADTFNLILNSQVKRDSETINQVVTNAQFIFSMTNSLPQGGVIKVTLPDSQMTLRSSASAVISPAAYTIVAGSMINSGTGSTTFSVVWCSTPSTQPGCSTTLASTNTISFTIGGGAFQNPSTSKIPDKSIEIQTFGRNGIDKIDSTNQTLNALPLISRGALLNGKILRSNHTVGQSTMLALEFKTQGTGTLFVSSRINVIFPPSFVYQTGTNNPVCKLNDGVNTRDVTCVPTYLTDSLGQKFIKEMYAVVASCSSLNCNGGTSYNLTIDGVSNAFNNKSMTGQSISIATMQLVSGSTSNFEIVNCADLTTFPVLQPAIMASVKPVRGQVIVDQQTTIDLSITTTTRLDKGGYIKVLVPKGEFQLNDNIPQFKYLTGSGAGTTQPLNIFEDSTFYIVLLIKENCATGTAIFCNPGTNIKLQITSGISNLGWVQINKSSTFEISTIASDGLSTIDNSTSQLVTPDLQMATIDIVSISQSSNQASQKGVIVDFQMRFGASVGMYDQLIINFDDTLIRKDNGSIQCYKVVGTTENLINCNAEPSGSNSVNKITVLRFCLSDCDATSLYTLRLKNVVNELTNESYSGNITIKTVQDVGTYQIGTGNYSMSRLPKLIPGQFKNVAITRSSTFQGQNADFSLTFTTPGYLMQSSVLELSLPKNQIALQNGKTDFLIKSAGQILSPKITPAVSQNYTTYIFDQWLCKPVSPDDKCSEGLTFSLQITNAANPFVQSSVFTDGFIIQIRSLQNSLLQFNTSQGLMATPSLEFGKIDNIKVNHTNSPYIIRPTQYLMSFTVQSSIPIGGKIRVTFPPNRVIAGSGTMLCSINQVVTPCVSSFSNPQTTVTFSGVCNSSQCTGPLNLNISITGAIKNPSVVTTITGNFTVETLSSSDFVVSQGTIDNNLVTQVLPEPFTTYSVQRSSLYMMADSEYRVSFQIVNPVPQTGFFRVIMPVDQVSVPTNGPTCKVDISLTSIVCRIIQKKVSEVWIDINQSCGSNGCTSGQTINILFEGLSNPSQFASNFADSTWKIYTMNSAKDLIDGVFTGVRAKPDLIGKQAVIQAISIDQPFVGRATFVKIGVIPGADMTNEAIFDVYFPDNMFYPRTNEQCATNLGAKIFTPCQYNTYSTGYISKVSIMSPCSQGCSGTASYFYDIPVFNRGDNYPYIQTLWRVIIKYPYVDVSAASVYNSLTIQPDVITKYYVYNNGQNQIDAETPLFVSFRPINFIPNRAQRGRIRVIFPASVRVILGLCSIRVDNVQISEFQCSFNKQEATITHNYQAPLIGRNVSLDVRTVANPNSTKPSEPFQIITEWDVKGNGVYYRIDQNIADVKWQATGMTQLLDSEIIRLSLNDDQSGFRTGQPTQLEVYIKLRHKLDSTSNILVIFPQSAQLSILPTAPNASSCFTIDQGGRNLNQLLCQVNQTSRTITVRNYCQVQSCNARSEVRFKLMETFVQNYQYSVSPLQSKRDSVVITTTTKEGVYYFDTADSGLFVKPELQPTQLMMPSPEILRTNNIINKRVSWVFSFKTNKNPVPQGGYLNITVPKDVLIAVQNSSLDVLNYDNGVRYWNVSIKMYTSSSINSQSSVREIVVWNLCNGTLGCLTGASYSFQIDWIRNPLSQISVNQPIEIEMRTQQGYLVERGTTQPVSKLFSELIPARLQNLQIRAINPEPSQITDYEIIFSADAEFSSTDTLTVTLPLDFNFTQVRQLQANTSKCTQLFTGIKLNCTINKQTIKISGLFTDNTKQYGVKVTGIVNPNITGPSQALIIEVANSAGQTIASRSTLSRVNILEPIDQTTCNQVCGACSGTNSTCTKCAVPSKYPLFQDGKCVDSCRAGFFFDQLNLRCVQCSHSCETCHNSGDKSCLKCAEGYLMEDGQCKTFCQKTLLENPTLRACSSSYKERCSARCLSCSLSPDFCLSCDPKSLYPVLDKSTGRCIPRNPSLCGPQNGKGSNRFYIDKKTNECRTCSELCKTCEDEAERCTQCWNGQDKFQIRSRVNELYDTCVEKCGLGTYYDKPNNTCKYCNPVCLTCSGQRPDQCQVCNKTPEARQLYLLDNQKCVISCPKSYNIETHNSTCVKGEVQVVSFSFLFLFSSVGLSTIIIAASVILTRGQNKTVDIFYAILSMVEFVNRLCLLGNLFMKSELTGVFPLSVCFMNLVATSSLGLFFNLLFMTPIYAHSPHFRLLWKQNHRLTYFVIEWLCYLAGVNSMRLVYSGFMGVKAFKSDLNNWRFFTLPLNMMSNYTLIFTIFQLALDIFVILFLSTSDDAFVLASLGLGINTLLVTLQLFKHLTTTRVQELIEEAAAEQQEEEDKIPKAEVRMIE